MVQERLSGGYVELKLRLTLVVSTSKITNYSWLMCTYIVYKQLGPQLQLNQEEVRTACQKCAGVASAHETCLIFVLKGFHFTVASYHNASDKGKRKPVQCGSHFSVQCAPS